MKKLDLDVLSVALMFIVGIAGAVILILNDHPWFGLALLVITASIRYKRVNDDKEGASHDPKN